MNKVTEIFCLINEFCSNFNQLIKEYALSHSNTSRKRHRKSRLSDSEVMTILVLFHLGGYRCLKHFYLNHVCVHMKKEFPHWLFRSNGASLFGQTVPL